MRSFVMVSAVFALWVLLDNDFVTCIVGVRDALSVLSFVILDDKLLLSILNALPIGFKAHVVNSVSLKHKLCRRCLGSSM